MNLRSPAGHACLLRPKVRSLCEGTIMNIRIMTRRIDLDDAAREYIRRCMVNALNRRFDRIVDAVIRLENLGSLQGGRGRRCQVMLVLYPRGSVRAQAGGPQLWAAVDRAVQKAARQLDRLLESGWSSRRRLSRRQDSRAA